MSTPSPLHVANTAQQMAKGAGQNAAVFNTVAMVSMGVMAAASVAQILHPLLRDLHAKDRRSRGR